MGQKIKLFAGLLFVGPIMVAAIAILALVFGAAAGLVGGLIFPQVFVRLSDFAFGASVPPWQIGAMLGFVTAFLRAGIPTRK